ncbi:extracellular solute-binding protein [Streptomyces rimosus]|uniref:extracellular solute-binding protein n=1 Tax=Streptomyces TaxID=1883 RepID=UPI0005180A13|nr:MULTISPECIES: extracellular solute-binding protein [Streptomyces]KOT93009.1 ABC transporter substrate-binding protein [Streptomyces rimosus subsp. pseudoverticillatus]RSO29130.1 ABC transporter substrate-binding protein [Streptomyces sp. WAC 06725]
MQLSARTAARAAALVLAVATAAGCAPSTSGGGAKEDTKTGTLRVWLFQEVNNKPKEAAVGKAVADFKAAHRGTDVRVDYIPVDTRAQRIKAAFNDPKSAPDVIEYGNTDTAGYVKDGGLADVSQEFGAWQEAKDTDPTAKQSVTVDGKVYGAPLFVGVRALYYRTDVFKELGIAVPTTQDEVAAAARKIRAERPELYGIAVGGAYTYGALPFLWAHGGELATGRGKDFTAAVNSEKSQAGIKAYADLFGDANCPAAKCAEMGGNDTVAAFAAGKAGMAIGGDFSHQAVEAGKVKGKYAVVPLPGTTKGSIAPAFAGGNNIGVLKSSSHRTLAVDLMKQLAGKDTQRRLFDAMGFLPTYTDVRAEAAKKQPFVKPFVRTLDAGAKFVPVSPAWATIDASLVLPTMYQEIVSGRKDVATASGDAAKKMDEAFKK